MLEVIQNGDWYMISERKGKMDMKILNSNGNGYFSNWRNLKSRRFISLFSYKK